MRLGTEAGNIEYLFARVLHDLPPPQEISLAHDSACGVGVRPLAVYRRDWHHLDLPLLDSPMVGIERCSVPGLVPALFKSTEDLPLQRRSVVLDRNEEIRPPFDHGLLHRLLDRMQGVECQDAPG